MKIDCIVIDDEQPAIEQLEEFISRIPFLNLIQSFNNGIEPINFLKENQIDLIFLDIEMEGFSGLQFIKTIQSKPEIILTTAYDQYAIEAFDLNVTDYLLKPISFERFIKSVDKAFDHLNKSKTTPSANSNSSEYTRDFFFVKSDYKMQRVDFKDILFIEGMNEYLRIHTNNDRIMTLMNFKTLEEQLPKENFIRVHKSYMVAINKIESVEKNRIKIGEQIIPISNSYKDIFYHLLKDTK